MKIGLDLDGTLLDCKPRQVRLCTVLARACGIKLDSEQYWALKREGYNNRAALREVGVQQHLICAIAALWEDAIENIAWLHLDTLLPQTMETLSQWREVGHSLHLISARRNKTLAMQQLRSLQLDRLLTTIDFVNPYIKGSKQPVMASLRLDFYVGDSESDAYAAHAAQIGSILVSSGMRSEGFLKKVGNASVVDSLACIQPDALLFTNL